MSILRLFSDAQRRVLRRLLTLASLEGAVTGLLLPLVNFGTVVSLEQHEVLALMGGFGIVLLASYWLRRISGTRLAMLLDEVLRDTRVRIAEEIGAAELRTIESTADLQTAFTRDIERLEELPYKVIDLLRYVFILVSIAVYVLVISYDTFLLWAALVGVVVSLLYRSVQQARRTAQRENAAWGRFHTELRRGLDGFKQLKLDPAARRSFAHELEGVHHRLVDHRLARDVIRRDMQVQAPFVIELGTGALLFVAPLYLSLDVPSLFQLVTVVFITLVPASSLARELQTVVAASVSFRTLETLDERLGAGREQGRGRDEPGSEVSEPFARVELRAACFDYLDARGNPTFSVGPIDLTIERGTLVFVRGGNGSGKTTLMKLLAGLYPPSRGSLAIDGRRAADELSRYRERFTVIFSDHHLFERLYGIDAPQQRVNELLAQFKLEGVTRYEDGRFTSLELSAGQHKRLAMVVALLEDRPILVFDEWDAHQDPELRTYFYTELLPGLRAQGKTVVAVSHDDRYFDRADLLVHLQDGRVIAATPGADRRDQA